MKPYAQYRSDGKLWSAGSTILGLCAAWNHATNPAVLMTDDEHKRSAAYARAIKARMDRLGYRRAMDYTEDGITGKFWPLPVKRSVDRT